MTPSAVSELFGSRVQDWQRHVVDLQRDRYEGADDRSEREAVLRSAFDLLTPVAIDVLSSLSDAYLAGEGDVAIASPTHVGLNELTGAHHQPEGGLLGSWDLSWPALRDARSRLDGSVLPPLQIFVMFPSDFTHPHLALFDLSMPRRWIACWPLQVATENDAARQGLIMAVIAEAELHERTFASDLNWRILRV
jgi:hypothetical protein